MKKQPRSAAVDPWGRTPLFYLAMDGELEAAKELIESGADVNVQDKNHEIPLHFAAREYRIAVAELLLKHGAKIDHQDSYGNTALHRAVFASRGRGEMIELLLVHGADMKLKNFHGVSPESLARTIANYDVAQYLNPKQ